MNIGIVIPTGPGRKENLDIVLSSIRGQNLDIPIVVAADGRKAYDEVHSGIVISVDIISADKHEPGKEPPRNYGARFLEQLYPGIEWVWFLDSDVYLEPGSVDAVLEHLDKKRIICGYYNWLNKRGGQAEQDYRMNMFEEFGPDDVLEYHLGAALANFSGNLVWPLDEFKRVGGFHPGLSAGRVDDGELGVRAATYGIGTSFLFENKGHHIYHDVDGARVRRINTAEVPLINQWHPYIQELGIVPRDLDGKRFNYICECGEEVNTLEMWSHYLAHEEEPNLELPDKVCKNTGIYKPNCSCLDCNDEKFLNFAPEEIRNKLWNQDA
jgi:glycosyltransferase involved in cell wall biosynthesis